MTEKDQQNQGESDIAPPDGGYGWIVTLCVALINGHSWGISAVYSVFLAYYIDNETFPGATRLQYALIGSLGVGCTLLISPLVTIAVREIGTRPIMLSGAIIQSLSLVCASFSTKIWHLFLSQGVLFGIGMGLLFLPSYGIVSQWFTRRRALASGFAIAGAGIGGFVYSLSTGAMLQSLGLQWAYRVLSIVSAVVNISSSLLIRTRYAATGAQPLAFDMSLLRRIDYLLILGFGIASMLGYFVLIFTLANYANAIGLNASQAAMIPALMMLAQAIGRPIIGWVGDSFGRINITLVLTLLAGLLALTFWVEAKTYRLLISFAMVEGLAMGVFWVTAAPVMAGVIGLKDLPSGLNLLWVALVLPCTFSEPIALEIVARTDSYLGAQLFTGTTFLLATICVFCLRGLEIARARDPLTAGTSRQDGSGLRPGRPARTRDFLQHCFRWHNI